MKKLPLFAASLVLGAVLACGFAFVGHSAPPVPIASVSTPGEIEVAVPATHSTPFYIAVGMHPSVVDHSEPYLIEVSAAATASDTPQRLGLVSFFGVRPGDKPRFGFRVPDSLAAQVAQSGHIHVWVRLVPALDGPGAPPIKNSRVTIDGVTF